MKIISIINMKGGVGKTTVSVGLAYELSESFSKNVLFVDIDPQTNATLMLLKEKKYREIDKNHKTLADLFYYDKKGLMGEQSQTDINRIIIHNPWDLRNGVLDLVPSSIRLFDSKRILTSTPYSEQFLKKFFQTIPDNTYDYVIIDSPPDFDLLVISALAASDYYIVPVRPDYMSQQGLVVLRQKLEIIKDHSNCELLGYVIGLIPPTRSKYHKSVVSELETEFGSFLLAKIKELQIYSEWPSMHLPLKGSKNRTPFVEIAKRVIERG